MTAAPVVVTPIAYRPADAAKVSGLSRSRIYDLIAAGALRARKDGHATVILHDDLVRYVTGLPVREPS